MPSKTKKHPSKKAKNLPKVNYLLLKNVVVLPIIFRGIKVSIGRLVKLKNAFSIIEQKVY